MRARRTVPLVTITLALVITSIQLFRSIGGSYDEFVLASLHHGSWELFYSQPWRVLTSPFIHQNILHFLENLFFLLLFGWQIERTQGRTILLGVFFGAIVTGYVIYLTFMHEGIIGTSGGICGLFGFSLIANRRIPWWTTLTHRPLHILYVANLLWAVIVDVTDWVPYNVAHLNHVVGILYGAAFGIAFLLRPRGTPWRSAVIALPFLLFASLLYSPWQIEWRLVKRPPILVTANADCQLRLDKQGTYPTANITFVNASSKPIAVYWFDDEGKPQYWFWLNAGESRDYYTYIGHPWCIVDIDSGEALQALIATKPEQIITIR